MIQVDPTGDAAAGPTAPVQVSPPTAPISVWLIPADERLNPRRAANAAARDSHPNNRFFRHHPVPTYLHPAQRRQ
jgi:hypothetical protein